MNKKKKITIILITSLLIIFGIIIMIILISNKTNNMIDYNINEYSFSIQKDWKKINSSNLSYTFQYETEDDYIYSYIFVSPNTYLPASYQSKKIRNTETFKYNVEEFLNEMVEGLCEDYENCYLDKYEVIDINDYFCIKSFVNGVVEDNFKQVIYSFFDFDEKNAVGFSFVVQDDFSKNSLQMIDEIVNSYRINKK